MSDCVFPALSLQPVVSGRCEALFDFSAENSGELSFKTGDVIVTLEWVNEEWMTGRMGDQEGMFPVSFVKILEELPKQKHTADDPSGVCVCVCVCVCLCVCGAVCYNVADNYQPCTFLKCVVVSIHVLCVEANSNVRDPLSLSLLTQHSLT